MVPHGLLFGTVLNPKLFCVPAIVDLVTDADIPRYPFHGQPHKGPSGIDHKLGKVPSWEYLGVAMVWSNQVGHVELANAGATM